jgi:hypothetical protein
LVAGLTLFVDARAVVRYRGFCQAARPANQIMDTPVQ